MDWLVEAQWHIYASENGPIIGLYMASNLLIAKPLSEPMTA